MKIPELKLNEVYYIFTFGFGGKYVKFFTQFICVNNNYYAKCNKNSDYTKNFIEYEDLYKCFITLDEFNKSVVIHETQFDKYKNIIRIPALNLSRKKNDIYRRQLLLESLIDNI